MHSIAVLVPVALLALTGCISTGAAAGTAGTSSPDDQSVQAITSVACPWAPPVLGTHSVRDVDPDDFRDTYTDSVTYLGTCTGGNRTSGDPSDVAASITVNFDTITIDTGDGDPLMVYTRPPHLLYPGAYSRDNSGNTLIAVANEGLHEVGGPLTLTWTDGGGGVHTTRVTYADPDRQEAVHRAIHAYSNTPMVC
jgi:hypothetical protein